jgi:hypothetical protein
MRILVLHLTRMAYPRICVAGVDVDTGKLVRPMRIGGHWGWDSSGRAGGPFAIGSVVDLGDVKPRGSAPEVEDVGVDASRISVVDQKSQAEVLATIRSQATSSLEEIFGPELMRHGHGAAIQKGHGVRSLGFLCPVDVSMLELIVVKGKPPRLGIRDQSLGSIDLPLTDLALVQPGDSGWDHRPGIMRTIGQRLGDVAALAVGLTRSFADGTPPHHHWLQVNNIHFERPVDTHPTFRGT